MLVHATDGNNVATVELTIVKEVLVYMNMERRKSYLMMEPFRVLM